MTIWSPAALVIWKFFSFVGQAKDFSELPLAGPILTIVWVGLLCVAYIAVVYLLTSKIIGVMVPTIMAEAKAAKLMSEALGGKVPTSVGTYEALAVDKASAQARTKHIMKVLLERAKSILKRELVRENIFTFHQDGTLRILDGFHFNMEGLMLGPNELTITIPDGFLTTGRAHKYFRAVLSLKGEDGKWPYAADTESIKPELQSEVQKAHPDLKWIISMPIPYQIKPFKMVCGVLNIDGLDRVPSREQMLQLLADQTAAAALIAILNRGTGFLGDNYSIPSEPSNTEQEHLKGLLIDPEEFDPSICPEPSNEFIIALSQIQGLEFFSQLSPTQVAGYLRDQLRS